MSVYSWENSSKPQKGKVKKAGTVVFHPDEAVDLSFKRLQKEYPLDRAGNLLSLEGGDKQTEKKKAPLMTAGTAKNLVRRMGFDSLLPCQAQCYRGIFNRRDVILHSRTGSGKTLAYALPIIERHFIMSSFSSSASTGPFLLIFLFSNELAAQTKGVLKKVYPKLNVLIAGFDDVESERCDVLIGTVQSLDGTIRGKQSREPPRGTKRTRSGDVKDNACDIASDNVEGGECSPSVSASNVRAIVVDEVDLTLGPRFSNIGRRMRNLLNFIRKANGSLVKGLLTDYRAHHYVLCGATIPNWVVKAGFLGVKKYYYQLVTVGTAKLPEGLECFSMHCPRKGRVDRAVELLSTETLGRTVIFGTKEQVLQLEKFLSTEGGRLSFSSLNPSKDEVERIQAVENFNSGATSVILCTDLAARGLDFIDVHMVLMLSLPRHNMAVETFVHRAGRTARAQRPGMCLQLHDECEGAAMEAIEKNAHVVFKKFIAAGKGGVDAPPIKFNKGSNIPSDASLSATFSLTVKNPFKFTRPEAEVPSALDVLKKNMGDLFSNVSNITEDASGENVRFEYPVSSSHEVKQRLWKFSLREIPQGC